mmetsp:Transcript_17398/g.18794  ORF Transcript_17398/g.18794 Transcript_17398/m.18794 type:complete len:80 (+) Transcript_17398:1587-1826(+)
MGGTDQFQFQCLSLLTKTDASHEREPQETVDGGAEKDGDDDMTERSILGDTGNEHPHKTGPRDPPGHIEDGPGTDEPGL